MILLVAIFILLYTIGGVYVAANIIRDEPDLVDKITMIGVVICWPIILIALLIALFWNWASQ